MADTVIKMDEVAAAELYEWIKDEMDMANWRCSKLALRADEKADAAFRDRDRIAVIYKAYVYGYVKREAADAK